MSKCCSVLSWVTSLATLFAGKVGCFERFLLVRVALGEALGTFAVLVPSLLHSCCLFHKLTFCKVPNRLAGPDIAVTQPDTVRNARKRPAIHRSSRVRWKHHARRAPSSTWAAPKPPRSTLLAPSGGGWLEDDGAAAVAPRGVITAETKSSDAWAGADGCVASAATAQRPPAMR
jgi:hypothetical protein